MLTGSNQMEKAKHFRRLNKYYDLYLLAGIYAQQNMLFTVKKMTAERQRR